MIRGTFYTEHALSGKLATTPEGFLLCEAVPLARTGTMTYSPQEVPVEAGPDGFVYIERTEEEVFRPETLASFEGKPVTNDHPQEDVRPDNWKKYAVGVVQNVRRGEGDLAEFMVGDLLITDANAIAAVLASKREVSCGYDAEYVQIKPGRGEQRQIYGNHVALVERGRCGPRCSIGDKQAMSQKTLIQKVMDALKGVADGEGGAGLQVLVGGDALAEMKEGYDKRFGDLEGSIKGLTDAFAEFVKAKDEEAGEPDEKEKKAADEAPEKEDEKKEKAADSLKAVITRAAILAPDFTVSAPTYDAKQSVQDYAIALNATKRAVLAASYKTDDGKAAIEPFTGANPNFDTLTACTVDAAFLGAAALLAERNNARSARTSVSARDFGKAPRSAEEINQKNRDFWQARK